MSAVVNFDDGKNEIIKVAIVISNPTVATIILNTFPPGTWNVRFKLDFFNIKTKYPKKNNIYPTK